jgi:hypothetical protein
MQAIFWACLFITMPVLAGVPKLSCIDKLLPSNRFSGLHQLTRQEWNDGKSELDPVAARQAVSALLYSKLLCKHDEINLTIEPSCGHILVDRDTSHTCYVESNLGYIFLTKDSGKNINFIFSRRP